MTTEKSMKNIVLLIFTVAFVLLAVAFLSVYFMGYRYIRSDGGVRYFGKTIHEQPTNGTLYYKNGLKGTITKEKESSLCKIEFNNGDIYEGSLKGINRHGEGKLTYYDTGDVYTGVFENDKITGLGVYVYENGDKYEGMFLDGKKDGFGTFTWADGSFYHGEFKNNKRHGVGEYRISDGSVYLGAYIEDKKSGNSDVAVPLLSGGTYTGKNRLEFSNGDIYVGDFSADERTGYGEYTWSSGERYVGEFKDGVMHGKGIYYRAGGLNPYDGYFENGNITIVGKETQKNEGNADE